MVQEAFELVEDIFKDKTDKGGHPYINHLIRVSSKMQDKSKKTIALLHDIIEDTDITKEDLIKKGFPTTIANAVYILSRQEGESYSNFINRIAESNNMSAIEVKLADLEDNMDINRISNPTEKDHDRVKKRYKPSYEKLQNTLKDIKRKL